MTEHSINGIFADLEQAEAERRDRENAEKVLSAQIATVLASSEGRAVVRWVLDMTGHDRSVTRLDPSALLIASARRDIGLQVLEGLQKAAPDLVALMIKEAENKDG